MSERGEKKGGMQRLFYGFSRRVYVYIYVCMYISERGKRERETTDILRYIMPSAVWIR